jgi:predicted cobalt transporter CbtA
MTFGRTIMVGTLLLRGMIAGFIAGLLCFCFLKIVGEPSVDRAIAFEAQMDEAKEHTEAEARHAQGLPPSNDAQEPELVSRSVQAGIGLLTGILVYSSAFGGLFALAFAFVHGRVGAATARITAAWLAVMGFVVIYLVPNLKYPANPPSIGAPDTIGMRTALYFEMIVISLIAVISAAVLREMLIKRFEGWNATLIAAAYYGLIVLCAGLLLPSVDEVPEAFPAVVLWQFRIASIGAQALMWAMIGVLFGALTERPTRVSQSSRFQEDSLEHG